LKKKKRKGSQRTKADLHTTPRVLETGEKKGFLLTWSGEATEERLGGKNEKLQFRPRGMNRWGMRRRGGLDADGRGAEGRLPVAAVAVRVGLAGWLGREGGGL